ncbi:hypothetical protein OK016_24035 [Vibrio chagasii]|nr:hypothetical protein [Vibrio chagasii]
MISNGKLACIIGININGIRQVKSALVKVSVVSSVPDRRVTLKLIFIVIAIDGDTIS